MQEPIVNKPDRSTAAAFVAPIVFALFAAMASLAPSPAQAGNCGAGVGPGVDWSDCRKRNLILDGSNLSGANLSNADFTSSDLRKSGLDGADLSKANLLRSMLDSSKAAGANFEKAVGFRTSFVGTDLTAARFAKSEMQRADFTGATLTDVDFEKSELGRANFSDADINGTNFRYANLARADFRFARFETAIEFTGAFLFRTRIEGVDLSTAKGLAQWQVDMACGDSTTKLPEGLVEPGIWPCGDE